MKRIIQLFCLILTLQSFALNAQGDDHQINIQPNPAITDDEITINLTGFLPSPCDYIDWVKWEHKNQVVTVYMDIELPARTCSDVLTPYAQELNIGQLPEGAYKFQLISYKTKEILAETRLKVNKDCIDPDKINPNVFCIQIQDPVCGCDGITYANTCYAEAAGVNSWTKGPCPDECINPAQIDPNPICIEIYDPVCGCDEITYDNECYAEAAGLRSWTKGPCSPPCIDPDKVDPNVSCPENYDPVCGCDGTTYSNACFAEAAGLSNWTEGECPQVCIDSSKIDPNVGCAAIYDPVCGCDGNTYGNACLAAAAGVTSWTRGECAKSCIDPAKIDPNGFCTLEYDPVCGCDGVTYPNPCTAEKAGVTSWTRGECAQVCIDSSKIDPLAPCTRELDPVCGCNGITYSNPCEAEKAGVTSWTRGECAQVCIDSSKIDPIAGCPEIYAPVCGCDGKTYDNRCFAEIAGVTSWTEGICEEPCIDPDKIDPNVGCPEIYAPVCGCDSVTYSNACEAEKAGLTHWTEGTCEPSCGEDSYEPNDYLARYLPARRSKQGLICPSGDYDWFFVFNRRFQPYIRITLNDLPDDYDLYLYDKRGNILDYSIQAGTADEVVVYNGARGFDFFFVYIKGYKDAYDPGLPYSIKMEFSARPYSETKSIIGQEKDLSSLISGSIVIPERASEIELLDLSVAPNPFKDNAILRFNLPQYSEISLSIMDIQGREVIKLIDQEYRLKGTYEVSIDAVALKPGMYFSILATPDERIVRKLIVIE